jgi:hypothetical protein
MIRIEGVPMVAEQAMNVTVDDLTTKEHEAFARLDAWMASTLTNRQVSNASAGAGRTHL